MKISTRGRYALRFMIYLAINSKGNYIALKEVSKSEDISIKYLERIATLLSKSSLVIGLQGHSGGYKLSRPANDYTVKEILQITENELAPVVDDRNESVAENHINTRPLWEGLKNVIDNYFANITLKDLVDKN